MVFTESISAVEWTSYNMFFIINTISNTIENFVLFLTILFMWNELILGFWDTIYIGTGVRVRLKCYSFLFRWQPYNTMYYGFQLYIITSNYTTEDIQETIFCYFWKINTTKNYRVKSLFTLISWLASQCWILFVSFIPIIQILYQE